MKIEAPEIAEAERLVTKPLNVRTGWLIRQRVEGRWKDHPQVRWEDAQIRSRTLRAETALRLALASRNLKGYEHLVQWAIEMADTCRASWKVSAMAWAEKMAERGCDKLTHRKTLTLRNR
jgi:hypothetical protein